MKKRALAVTVPAVFLCLTIITAVAQQGANPAGGGGAPPGVANQSVSHDPADVPAGTFVVDPLHSVLIGSLLHQGLEHFTFRFRRFDARFTYDPAKPDNPNIEVSIDPLSLDTNVAGFDAYLATNDRYFNVVKFPEIKFVSTSLKRTGPDKGVMAGNITFLGVTKPLNFDVTFIAVSKGRNGSSVGLSATTTIRRSDFGFAKDSEGLSDEVAVSVDAAFVEQRPQR
jgi:polyisoprenoid-binding protein YceI